MTLSRTNNSNENKDSDYDIEKVQIDLHIEKKKYVIKISPPTFVSIYASFKKAKLSN